MKSFAVAASFVALAVAQQAYPPQVSEAAAFLPTQLLAENPNFATQQPAAWATLQAKMHSLVAADEGFWAGYSQGVPGFGGLSALIATAYDTALLTGNADAATTSSSSSSSASTSSSSSDTTSTSSSSSSSSTSSSLSVPPPVVISSTSSIVTTTTPSTTTTTPASSSSLPPSNAAPTGMAFGAYGAAVVGIAGLAVLL